MHKALISSPRGPLVIPLVPTDAVGVKERVRAFTSRSIKQQSKLQALKLAMSLIDLTTLEGADTPERVLSLCAKARYPVAPAYLAVLAEEFGQTFSLPSVAAVCVYPPFVATARKALAGTGIAIAAVATGFPAGQLPLDCKLQEVAFAVSQGADEIDMVIDRGAFLSGQYQKVFDEIVAVKALCGEKVQLKVILETGELRTFDQVRLASWLAMEAGADFIKTSTGKISPAATLEVSLVMLQAIWDFYQAYGKKVGMKPAGGIRDAKTAIAYLVMVHETLGLEWLTPALFRFGASALLNDLLRQIFKQACGPYFYTKIFSDD